MEQEAEGLAMYVQHLIANRGYTPGDILVLCPRRLLGYGIRDALRVMTIPTHSFYHEEALEPDEAQEAFTLLTLLAMPDDRVSLRFWLGLTSPSWRAREYARLRNHCETSGQSPREALERLVAGQLSIAGTAMLQERFRVLLARLAALAGLGCSDLVLKQAKFSA